MFSIVSLLHLNFQKVVLNELRNPVLAFSLILQMVTNAQKNKNEMQQVRWKGLLGLVVELRFCVILSVGGEAFLLHRVV